MSPENREILEELGVDISTTLHRFIENEEFYFRMLRKLEQDHTYQALIEHMGEKNYEEAFKDAHTLKGLGANLGLGILEKDIVDLTEALRHPPYDEAEAERLFRGVQKGYKICVENIQRLN